MSMGRGTVGNAIQMPTIVHSVRLAPSFGKITGPPENPLVTYPATHVVSPSKLKYATARAGTGKGLPSGKKPISWDVSALGKPKA